MTRDMTLDGIAAAAVLISKGGEVSLSRLMASVTKVDGGVIWRIYLPTYHSGRCALEYSAADPDMSQK